MKWNRFIGLSGVDPSENSRARLCSKILEWPILAVTLWVIALWYLSWKDSSYKFTLMHDAMLWSLFIVETLALSILVDDTKRYLKGNWINLVIIVLGLPILWGGIAFGYALRALRLFTLFSLLFHVGSSVRQLLSQNSLGPTLFGAAIVIVMAGFMIAVIDPGISSASEGIWWAWVTVTTVGYGDVVPTSSLGRFFGGILIFIGIGLFAMLTASFAALFISRTEEEEHDRLEKALDRVEKLEQQIDKLHDKIDHLIDRSSPPKN
jgi:voltage-gated potassium channel